MRRFTILGLMGVVLVLALAIGALRDANDMWAGGLLMATTLLIGMAALGAVHDSGRRRARRLGFAVFAGGYFALAFLGLSDQNLAKLPTSWLLNYVHERVAPQQTFSFVLTAAPPGQPGQANIVLQNVNSGPTPGTMTTTTTYALASSAPSPPPPTPLRLWLPGAANAEAFRIVGHCLFALLAGVVGAFLSRRFQARAERMVEPEVAG